MVQERPITPEKQLLELIENSKGKNSKIVGAYKVKRKGKSFFSFNAWLGRIFFLKGELKKRSRKKIILSIKAVNGFMTLGLIVLAGTFIYIISGAMNDLKKVKNRGLKSGEIESLLVFQGRTLNDRYLSYYMNKINKRDIFKMENVEEEIVQKEEPDLTAKINMKSPNEMIIEATKNLKLVGISWSNNPDALIEDTEALRSFIVRKGDMIGEVKVDDILKDKVLLGFKGEQIEIK
ncbi:MAG: hypothetical protein KAI91_03860 [Candidatus Omnitrophica bacterium]|nr:hypothetical protein [Candidatus Omnitrophota bacterium]